MLSRTINIRSILKRFIALNQDLCNQLERCLPQARTKIFYLYQKYVLYMNLKHNQIVVDVGGGKSCPFAKYKDPKMRTKIIAVDVSSEEMENNHDVDEKRVANITQGLPFENEEVDLIVSRSALEHLDNLDHFVINSKKVLKSNGCFIHLFPSRYAPFAIINMMLPKKTIEEIIIFVYSQKYGYLWIPSFL